MFRRSRFSIRPNVVTAGRTAAASQEAPSTNQEASETPKDVSESSTTTTTTTAVVTDNKSVVTPSEKPAPPGDGNDQNGEGTSSSAAVQRRKRFSIKPKVAPGRPTPLARTPKSPFKAVSETPIEIPASDLDKPTKSTQSGTIASPQRLLSPRRRRPSEESKQPKTQPKPIIPPSDSSEHSAVPNKDFLEQIHLPTDSGKELESNSGSQVEEVPSRLPNKVPPSLPDKEAIAISEKAKNLVSSKTGLSLSQPAFSLSRLLNDPSDLQRIAKAQKLRELLKQEMHKEKKIKRAKARVKEYTLDPAKMTMRDLIRYLPLSNPMTSSLEDATQENETVVPPSPVREDSPERAQEPVVLPKIASPREEADEEAAATAEAEEEEEQDDAIMVPQVKVAEDGTLIIDEESLTVEVQRAKGPNPAQDRDPIFERGSTTTYSSFRKGTYSKPWSKTDMFFLAISMVGTDFSMICQLFPLRARSEIKNKFKKEERENAWRIDKAFRERRKLDIEYFSKLLEKILEVQKTRKKLKSLAVKKSPKKKENKKTKGKKASRKLSVVEEGDEEEQNEISDFGEEGEKENEDLCNEGGTTVAKPQKKRKRKNKQDASTKEPNDKKNKTSENEHDEAYIPGDTEAALPEDCPKLDTSEKIDNVSESKDNTIKPAKLSRGRAPKPLLPLGRKWGKQPPPPSTKTNDAASDKEDESEIDGASKEQVNEDPLPLKQATKRKSASDDIYSGEEDVTVQPPRPTRYGRVPKPTKPLNIPGIEATHSSETTPASPAGSTAPARPRPKCTAKRGSSSKLQSAQESKKPKLVTLRASQSEYSDEEDEKQREEEEVEEEHPACSSSNDSTAPAFVPASLRSPHPVISEVEETMEELDILANMPDVLGISQDVLCPDAFCERAQNEIGTAETCEHQLDLLIDVIDFLSIENTEVSEDKSYNEAAQTLLTIGNMAHLSQSAQNQLATQDDIQGTTPVSVNETSQHLEEEMACCSKPAAQEENSATLMSGTSVPGGPETVTTVELENCTTDTDAIPVIKSSDQRTAKSDQSASETHNDDFSEVQLEPSLGQTTRESRSTSASTDEVMISHVGTTEISCNSQVTSNSAVTFKECSDNSAPVGVLPVSQKEESEVPSTSQTRKSRIQKVKPKLNLAQTSRTVRSKPQTTKDIVKDSTPTPNLKFTEKTRAEVEAEPSCVTSSEKTSLSPCPASTLTPSSDLGTTFTPTEELSTTEEKKTDVGVVGQVELGTTTLYLSDSENKNLSEVQFEPRREQATRDTMLTCTDVSIVSTDEILMSHVGITETSANNLSPPDSVVTESQIGQESNIDFAQVQESSDYPDSCVLPGEVLPVSQKKEREVASTCQTRKSRFQKVRPNLNLSQTSRTIRSKPQTTKENVEKDSNPTPNPKFHEKSKADVEAEPTCIISLEKPSLSSGPASDFIPSMHLGSTLTPLEELSTTEEKKTDVGVVSQRMSLRLKVKMQSNIVLKPLKLIKQLPNDFGALVCHKLVSERQPDIQEPVERAIEQCSNQNPSPSDAGSLLGSTQVIEQLSQHDPPPNVAESSLGCLTQLLDNFTPDASTSSTGGTKSHPSLNTVFPDMLLQQKPLDADEPFFILSLTEIPVGSLGEAVDSVPESLPYLPVTDVSVGQQSVSGESLAAAGNGLLSNVAVFMEESGETGLIKAIDIGPDPAANIGSIMENPVDPHAKLQVKPNTTKRKQASKTLAAKEAELIPIYPKPTGHSGPSVQPKVFYDDVTEPQKGSDDPMDGEKETLRGGEDPEDSSSGAQISRTRRSSSRNRRAEGSLFLPSETSNAAPASGETLSTSSTTSPTQTEVDADQTCELSPLCSDTTPNTSLYPAESSSMEEEPTSVSQYFLSDIFTEVTAEKNDETEIPPAAQTEMDAHRREPAKLQVKPNTTKRKQAMKTLTAKEAELIPIHPKPTGHSGLAGLTVQPKVFDDNVTEPQKGSDDHMDVEKETLTGGEDPEDSSSGAQTTRSSSRNRKAKGSLSLPSKTNNAAPASDSPPGKEAPKGRKVKTPRAAGKPSTPVTGVSTSYDVTPTFSPTQPTQEAHLTSSTTSPTQTEVDNDQTCELSPLCSDTTPSTSLYPAEVRKVQVHSGEQFYGGGAHQCVSVLLK
ncbi:hypothetical protein FQN60_008139 [Etheostoma spectabile]|uniref:Transcription factor TFIIIB component B'' Myb domain-containing protein n=1 Tax=Etheostoma spectabile TaxID=54343 RepID=A0A5J5CSZ0_9PERO|nr:hypothetical protein FQN60_008139 [Etheostoma spectabile]